MENEYLIQTSVQMDEHDYYSVPGRARPVYGDYVLTATVINTKEGEDRHTIGGVKYWVPDEDNPSYPEKITLHVFETELDGTVRRKVDTVILNRPDGNASVAERVMWTWTMTRDDIDTALYDYTVTEEFPADYPDASRYWSEVYGTDVVNRWTWEYGPRLRIQKVWDEVAAACGQPLRVEVLPLRNFYRAEDYHQDYLDKNPDGYCHLPAALFEFAKNFRAGGNNE
jgi:hypothetical protein